MTPTSNTRFIVAMITILGVLCSVCGAILLARGYQGGEIFAAAGTGAISGLLGMLRNTPTSASEEPTSPPNPKP